MSICIYIFFIQRKHSTLFKKALQKKEAKYKNASSISCETSDPISAKQPKLMNQNMTMFVRNTVSKEQVCKIIFNIEFYNYINKNCCVFVSRLLSLCYRT